MDKIFNEILKQPTQPAPNLVSENSASEAQPKKQTRAYNYPKVGVVEVPEITQNPVGDLLELKKQENPKTAYKLTPKRIKNIKFINFASILTCVLGLGAGIVEILKIKKNM